MTNFKTRRRISLVFTFLIVVCTTIAITFAFRKVEAQVSVSTSAPISSEYAFGDVFILPDCTFSIEGQSAKGSASVEFPDGTLSNKSEISLTQIGNHTVKYIATIDGKVYTKEYTFSVLGKLANYKSNKTSMEYGLCTTHGANTEGLIVKIANGDALEFDHVFDMSSLSMTTKLLEGFVIPDVQGSIDFAKMVFTFTDIEDPSVQLVFHGNFYDDPNAYGLTWFTAAGNGQVQCGLEHVGKLHVGKTQGCMVPHSFMAIDTGLFWGHLPATKVAPDSKQFYISYDAQRNQAWAGGKIISDLDDSYYYDKLWFGFPSGKAKLTISAMNYSSQTATMCFTSILGVDLSAERFIDDEAPEITVDNDYDVMPDAVVGKFYPIPTASAIDGVDGVRSVNVSVWRNYGMTDASMISIEDGKFYVPSVGIYAIVYESVDFNGNLAKEVLWVRAYKSLAEKLTLSLEEFNQTVELGELQTLPKATVSGGSGNITLTYTITKGSTECEIKDGAYRLEEAGEWVLTCVASDYIGNAVAEARVITGVSSGRPIIFDEPLLPNAFISGSTYTVPTVYAYDYSTGSKVEKICNLKVEYNGSSNTYLAGQNFVPTVTSDKDVVKLSFVSDGVVVYEKQVPTRIVFSQERIPGATERYRTVIDVEKYFHLDENLTIENDYELGDLSGLLLRANSNVQLASASFINTQLADTFSIGCYTVPNAGKFSKIAITLTDSVDKNISIKIYLIKNDGQTLLQVGDTVMSLNVDFDGGVRTNYNVGYSDGNIIVNYTTKVGVSKCENGQEFKGFTSGKLYFDIEMYDVLEGASLFINEISSVKASNNQDTTGPSIVMVGEAQTNGTKDSNYTINRVVVGDVLSPNSLATLTVTNPLGEIVTDVNGVRLENVDATVDYVINLSEYGTYHVSVQATEESLWNFNNKSYFAYVVMVIDSEKPTITFEGEFKTQIKVGENLVIPKYVVADNYSTVEEIEVFITVTNPKGMPIYLYGESNAVLCQYTGVYKVCIFVMDKTGNLLTYEVSVTVS